MTFYTASLVIFTALLLLASSIAMAHAAAVRTKTTTTTTTRSTSLRPVKTRSSRFSFFDVVGRVGSTTSSGAGSGPTDFVSGGGDGNPGAMCDFDAQDCGDGEKCTVENLWSGTPRCRSIVNNPDQVGDPCSTLGSNDGDSCDIDGICLREVCRLVDTDGTLCGIKDISHYYPSGVRLCEAKCDPIVFSECPSDSHCTRTDGLQDGVFSCQVTSGPLAHTGKACSESCDCRQGSICLASSVTSYCDNELTKCCVPLCDLDEDDEYCSGNTSCKPIYNHAPPGYEHLGACVLF